MMGKVGCWTIPGKSRPKDCCTVKEVSRSLAGWASSILAALHEYFSVSRAAIHSADRRLHLSSKDWRLDKNCVPGGESGDAHFAAVPGQRSDACDEWHYTPAKAHRSRHKGAAEHTHALPSVPFAAPSSHALQPLKIINHTSLTQ